MPAFEKPPKNHKCTNNAGILKPKNHKNTELPAFNYTHNTGSHKLTQ